MVRGVLILGFGCVVDLWIALFEVIEGVLDAEGVGGVGIVLVGFDAGEGGGGDADMVGELFLGEAKCGSQGFESVGEMGVGHGDSLKPEDEELAEQVEAEEPGGGAEDSEAEGDVFGLYV